jgi:hypothetical protein
VVRRTSLARLLVVAALGWLVMLPASAAAFPSSGPCSLTLISSNALGEVLDTVETGDDSASARDPFLVDWEGTVGWSAIVAAPLQDYHFEVDMFGIPTPLRGGSANTSDSRSSTGAFAFTGSAAFRFTGLYYLTARISGSGTDCEGELVVQLIGDPVGTIPFFVGLGLIAIGLLLVAWGAKGHLLAGVFGGVFLGLGVSVTLTIFSILPFGGPTPAAVAAVGFLVGLLAGSVGRARLAIAARSSGAQVGAMPASATALPMDTAGPDEGAADAAPGVPVAREAAQLPTAPSVEAASDNAEPAPGSLPVSDPPVTSAPPTTEAPREPEPGTMGPEPGAMEPGRGSGGPS